MADEEQRKKRTFKKIMFRGVELEKIMEMPLSEFKLLLKSKLRRRINRGLTQEEVYFIRKCEKEQNVSTGEIVKTKVRSFPILPVMIGLTIGIYNGVTYVPVEIKPEMLGHRLKDYISTKSICKHGAPGVGATSSSKFVPLK